MKYDLLILGGGESGTGAALLAAQKGLRPFLSDAGKLRPEYKALLEDHHIEYEEESHNKASQIQVSECVKSPGIPQTHPLVIRCRENNIPVLSEIAFAGRFTNAKITGITGTNGKTTTTLLTYHLYKKGGLNVRCAGNVGQGFAMDLFSHNEDPDHFVLELSSFQLEDIGTFRIHTAILTNLSPDHLDRYKYDPQAYYAAKMNITANQQADDYFIWCADDAESRNTLKNSKIPSKQLRFSIQTAENMAAWLEQDKIFIQSDQNPFEIMITELALKGKHNVYNSLAAALASRVQEIRKEEIREALSDFQNIEHRLEFVNRIKGVNYINDSKATNVNAAWYALECTEGPIIWIAGGVDKGNDYADLVPMVKDKVKVLICLGTDNEPLKKAFQDIVPSLLETTSMTEAVKAAYYLGKKGDTVLLSPACASFDLFRNYEDRGRQFKQCVREL